MTNTDINKNLSRKLMEEIKEKIQELRELGISEREIASLLQSQKPLQKITISRSHKIYLGENRIELRLEPLVKAVYLLFLRHPEGIVFKKLPDYREELTRIYAELRPSGLTEKALQSIEDVTNPILNSINEKCARIRSAFIKEFDESLAKNYFVTGERGEAKKIVLPRDLVVWES